MLHLTQLHEGCIIKLQRHLQCPLIRRSCITVNHCCLTKLEKRSPTEIATLKQYFARGHKF